MNEQTAFFSIVLRRFFSRFRHICHHKVPLCKFVYYHFLVYLEEYWNAASAREKLPYWPEEEQQYQAARIYEWADEPYQFDPHPDGVLLMRGGFGDIASLYLPQDGFFLISPGEGEVNTIKRNRPDLTPHDIQAYYRENPLAVKELTAQIAQVVQEQKNDPIFGSPHLLDWFTAKMPEIVSHLDAANLLFETQNVGAVLTISTVYSMDGALNLIARARRVPSFTLQHGVIAENDLHVHIPILATKKMVWGEMIQEWYQQYGYPATRVSVIGSPRFDIIRGRTWCGQAKLRQKLQIDQTKKIVVFATQIFHYNQIIAPIVLEGLQSIPEIFVIMLLHPGDDPAPHEQLAAGYCNCKVIRFSQIHLYDALSGADFFITYYSTAALEAMFFNIPVITVEPEPPTFSFGDLGASLKVSNAAELNQLMRRLLSETDFHKDAVTKYQDFFPRYCRPDGSAGKRLFEEIELLRQTGGVV